MGHREYFIYSESGKYSPEEILEQISKKIVINNPITYEPTVFLFCKTEVLQDFIHLNNVFLQGSIGAVIEPDLVSNQEVINILPDEMKNDIKINMISFLDCYEDYFKDSKIIVNGREYYSEKENQIKELEEDEER